MVTIYREKDGYIEYDDSKVPFEESGLDKKGFVKKAKPESTVQPPVPQTFFTGEYKGLTVVEGLITGVAK